MFILLARWEEPCQGNAAWTVNLTDAEAVRIQSVLDWIEENAGQEYGHCLCAWTLQPTDASGSADITGVDAVLDEIALNSRYFEIDDEPGAYYEARNADLDSRAAHPNSPTS